MKQFIFINSLLLLSCILALSAQEAPTEDARELLIEFHEEMDEVIAEARDDIEELRDKLLEDLKNAQEKYEKRGDLDKVTAFKPFLHYFDKAQAPKKDVFGTVKKGKSKKKPRLLPSTNALPSDSKKMLERYISTISKHIEDAVESEDKEKSDVIKKLEYQVKKLTRSKETDQALAIRSFIAYFSAQTFAHTALRKYLPKKSHANCEVYMSFDLNTITKGKQGFIVADLSDHKQSAALPAGLKLEKGVRNEALSFNAKHAVSLNMPDTLKKAKSISLGAWIYMHQLPKKRNQLTICSNNYTNWEMQIERRRLLVEGTDAPQSATKFQAKTWYHVLWTYDHKTKTHSTYVNGKLEESHQGAEIKMGNDKITIGDRSSRSCGPWNGLIDEVMIFSRALTAEEIKDISKL